MSELVVDESLLYDEEGEFHLAAATMDTNSKHLLPELFEKVAPEDFYRTGYGEVWRAAKNLHDQGKRISARTLLVEMSEVANRDLYVEAVRAKYVPEGQLHPAADSVAEKSRWRLLTQALRRSAFAMTELDTYDEALEFAHQQLQGLSNVGYTPAAIRKFSDAVEEWLDWFNEDPENSRVFATPWEDLNHYLAGGLHSKRSYIIAGRPGSGKTIGALNIAAHIAESGYSSMVFSLEMPTREVVSRTVAASSEANYGQITKREVDDFNMNRIGLFLDNRALDMNMFVVDDSSMKIEKIWALAKRQKASPAGLDVLVIDHIGLVRATNSRVGREQQLSHISWMCTLMAKDLDCAVLIAAQLNRGPAQENSVPKPSDLRESGSLEQNADVVLLIHHEMIDGMGTGEVQIHLGKNRTGVGGAMVMLPYRPHMARFG